MKRFIIKEWLFFLSLLSIVISSFLIKRVPVISLEELEVTFVLFALFVAVKGIERSGVFSWIAHVVASGDYIPLKLVLTTFFMSMIVTNDVALMVMLPLTLLLNLEKKDIVVILEALAANAGSALTPIGNPQNLLIFWYYKLSIKEFISTIALFSVIFFLFLFIASLFLGKKQKSTLCSEKSHMVWGVHIFVYIFFLMVLVLVIIRVLPFWMTTVVVLYSLFFDFKTIREVDFFLLLTFLCFFAAAENIKYILLSSLEHAGHIFLISAFVSHLVSNVPATVLFSKFTSHWKALLWGSNVGGFGGIFGSLANLIAYRFYVVLNPGEVRGFTIKFLILSYIAFVTGIGLYFLKVYIL